MRFFVTILPTFLPSGPGGALAPVCVCVQTITFEREVTSDL